MLALTLALAFAADPAPIKVLIVDGQNNHAWKVTTPLIKKALEEAKLFSVDIATSPPAKGDIASFKPKFSDYQVVVSNYNGEMWGKETREAFNDFVKGGGGFVSVHAANNAFTGWLEYNEMIGLGGWGGRNEKSGPYVRVKDGKVVRDTSKGNGGSHGRQHAFLMETLDAEHPITKGLPAKWMHAQDELYDRLRGPAKGLTVLAYAKAEKSTGGSGENEPLLMTIEYGKGRVFHTALGHGVEAMKCVGFIVTLQRGTEWAATGKVTRTDVPADFPTADKTSSRK
ncbi:MAG: ThuA domain-containing protein [Gemmataceae bacterium]